jgi:hypothetical protein
MKFLLRYKILENVEDDIEITKPWIYNYKKIGGHNLYKLKEKYKSYLINKYNVESARTTVNYNGLVLTLLNRESYGKNFNLDRNSLMPLITEFNKYNWLIEVSNGTLTQSKEFVIKMTDKQTKKFFEKLDDEIEMKKNINKYNL